MLQKQKINVCKIVQLKPSMTAVVYRHLCSQIIIFLLLLSLLSSSSLLLLLLLSSSFIIILIVIILKFDHFMFFFFFFTSRPKSIYLATSSTTWTRVQEFFDGQSPVYCVQFAPKKLGLAMVC
jgi:hypothetical protein